MDTTQYAPHAEVGTDDDATDRQQGPDYAVFAPGIADEIDRDLSPMDTLAVLDQVSALLPRVHRRPAGCPSPDQKNITAILTARLTWAGLLFDYVEVDGRIVVVRVRPLSQDPLPRIDCLLDDAEWEANWEPKRASPTEAPTHEGHD